MSQSSGGRTPRYGKQIDLLSETREHLERRVQERTVELATANENLRDLSARLLKVQDEERKRFARELHDSVGQILAAISMNIAVVQAQSAKLDSAWSPSRVRECSACRTGLQ